MMSALAVARSPLVCRTPLRTLANTGAPACGLRWRIRHNCSQPPRVCSRECRHAGFTTSKQVSQQTRSLGSLQVVRAEPQEERRPPPNKEFGYSRKDVIIIGAALLGLGYAIYYGLQAFFGVDPLMAGNFTQLIIFVGLCIGWIGSYISRVANKVRQLFVTADWSHWP